MNEALNTALNHIGYRVFSCAVGATPTSEDELLGITRISLPRGLERSLQKYADIKTGTVKKVPTTKEMKNIGLEVAHEDEETITLLDELILNEGEEMYRDFYFIPKQKSSWTKKRSFYVTAPVVDVSPNDVTADGYQATSYTIAPQGLYTIFDGTIE